MAFEPKCERNSKDFVKLNIKLKPSLLAVLGVFAASSVAHADAISINKIEVVSSTPPLGQQKFQ